ncbi:MAG TPA: ankyrin repeat domain-containing protein, partial [Alphaproteobacteria bacterium]|nr:ankyrin repeat domain-containing protein [Alphaproteobacteria bacterium]
MLRRVLILSLFALGLAPALANAEVELELYKRAPLADSARAGDLELVQRLLVAGQSPNVNDFEDRPALVGAAMGGYLGVVNALVKYGARIDARDRAGNTALHLAAERGHDDIVAALIE